jgi:hypothetical protein
MVNNNLNINLNSMVPLNSINYKSQHATDPVRSGPGVGPGNLYVILRLKG